MSKYVLIALLAVATLIGPATWVLRLTTGTVVAVVETGAIMAAAAEHLSIGFWVMAWCVAMVETTLAVDIAAMDRVVIVGAVGAVAGIIDTGATELSSGVRF